MRLPSILRLERLGVVVMKPKMPHTTTTATDSKDVFYDLQLSVQVHKQFGRETVKYHINQHVSKCSRTNATRIEDGSREDYEELVQFHYRQDSYLLIRKSLG